MRWFYKKVTPHDPGEKIKVEYSTGQGVGVGYRFKGPNEASSKKRRR